MLGFTGDHLVSLANLVFTVISTRGVSFCGDDSVEICNSKLAVYALQTVCLSHSHPIAKEGILHVGSANRGKRKDLPFLLSYYAA
jgi:hypothetical protein